jgi:repressor LexA
MYFVCNIYKIHKQGELLNQPLTPNELKVYKFLKDYISKNGSPPSYVEIQSQFGFKSIGSVQQYIEQLTSKNYLKDKRGLHQKRALELVDNEESLLVSIPLEGKVAAGRLTEAIQNREYFELPRSFLRSTSQYFALKVKGDSMIEEHIMDGDVVVIKRQEIAQNGQTIVALVENEATIKKYFQKPTHIELVPANPNYDVIKVRDFENFKILGILSSVIRRLD